MPAHNVTGSHEPLGVSSGPVSYASSLWVISFSELAATSLDRSKLALFRSDDGGASWTVADEKEIGGADDTGLDVDGSNFISMFVDVNFPTSPYLYIIHADTAGRLRVARASLLSATFDDESAAGPDIQGLGGFDGSANPNWFIAQSSEGGFGILAGIVPDAGDEARVFSLSLSADFGTWSARTETSGQGAGANYVAAGIARGADGRVHGLVEVQSTSDITDVRLYHTLVLESGGGVGGGLDEIADGTSVFFQRANCGAYSDGKVAFLFCSRSLSSTYNLAAAVADSEDTPAFDVQDIDESATLESYAYSGAIAGDADGLTVAGGLNTASARVWTFDGSTWVAVNA
jgi:hypothetical protein